MSKLLCKHGEPDSTGRIHHITPETANWGYVGFDLFELKPGQSIARETGNREVCLVLVTGNATVQANGETFQNIGGRSSVFDNVAPYAVYIPAGGTFEVRAETDLTLGVCSAPGKSSHPVRLISPPEMGRETRGVGANIRHVCNILPDTDVADSLLVVEVVTPGGNWSSYPPHRHDTDDLPQQSSLEETYYHRLNPSQGFAFQRVYTDDRSLDETMAVEDGDVVMVPKGYHPVGAPHGYDLYYLNVMAGPVREWKFHNDPDHEWIVKKPA
jgi:5-deoxy-glucuronate isomerase